MAMRIGRLSRLTMDDVIGIMLCQVTNVYFLKQNHYFSMKKLTIVLKAEWTPLQT